MSSIVAVFGCAALDRAQARIGDSLEQCQARYGEIVSKETDNAVPVLPQYKVERGLYEIYVTIMGGKCVAIMFANKNHADLSPTVIDAILKANSYPDLTWVKNSEGTYSEILPLAKMVRSGYVVDGKVLVVNDISYLDAMDRYKKKSVEGF